jgi:cytoskeleton protein RodZ
VFARGSVRSYARLLELEPEPLVAQYPRPRDPLPRLPHTPEPPVWEWIRRRPALVLGVAGGVLLVLLVLLVALLWPDAAPTPEPAGTPEVEDGLPPATPEDTAPGWLPPQRPPTEDYLADVEADPAAFGSGAAATTRTRGAMQRITVSGDDRLALIFTDDCWIEVRGTDGGNLFSDLGRRGAELMLVGQGPFRILLGYAPGVELAFNGEPVPLAPHTRNNVATLVLGQ